MNDQLNIHKELLQKVFEGLRTDQHDKFVNEFGKTNYAIGKFYPDIILTNKGTNDVAFIVEILTNTSFDKANIVKKLKPLSELGGVLYVLVNRTQKQAIEQVCREEGIKVRFGTYHKENNTFKINFE